MRSPRAITLPELTSVPLSLRLHLEGVGTRVWGQEEGRRSYVASSARADVESIALLSGHQQQPGSGQGEARVSSASARVPDRPFGGQLAPSPLARPTSCCSVAIDFD